MYPNMSADLVLLALFRYGFVLGEGRAGAPFADDQESAPASGELSVDRGRRPMAPGYAGGWGW